MPKTLLFIITLIFIFFWMNEPPHTAKGQVIRPFIQNTSTDTPKSTLISTPDPIDEGDMVGEKAKLLNSKIRVAEKNRKEIDNLNLKVVKEASKKVETHRHPKGDTVVLIESTETVFPPDTIVVEEPFLEGKTFWGKWWRAQIKLFKHCSLHKKGKKYKEVQAKLIPYESKDTSRHSSNREEIPR